jgi:hypothetical protein
MENIKQWRTKSRKTTEDRKIAHGHGLAKSVLWKWLYYQSNIHVQCNSHQNSNKTLINPKVHLQAQETVNSQGKIDQKEQHYRFTNPTSNYNTQPWKALAQRQNEQWNRIEHPDTNPYTYTHLSFDKGVKTYEGKKTIFSKNVAGQLVSTCRKLKLDSCLSPSTSINSKWLTTLI